MSDARAMTSQGPQTPSRRVPRRLLETQLLGSPGGRCPRWAGRPRAPAPQVPACSRPGRKPGKAGLGRGGAEAACTRGAGSGQRAAGSGSAPMETNCQHQPGRNQSRLQEPGRGPAGAVGPEPRPGRRGGRSWTRGSVGRAAARPADREAGARRLAPQTRGAAGPLGTHLELQPVDDRRVVLHDAAAPSLQASPASRRARRSASIHPLPPGGAETGRFRPTAAAVGPTSGVFPSRHRDAPRRRPMAAVPGRCARAPGSHPGSHRDGSREGRARRRAGAAGSCACALGSHPGSGRKDSAGRGWAEAVSPGVREAEPAHRWGRGLA